MRFTKIRKHVKALLAGRRGANRGECAARVLRRWPRPAQPQAVPVCRRRSQTGHSLLEMTVVTAILGFVMLALLSLFSAANSLFRAGDVKADIEEQGRMALMRLADDVRQAGYYTDPTTGASYPYMFTNGMADGHFAGYSHTPADNDSDEGTSAYGPSREIVFVMAEDLDGNGVLTDMLTGEIEWSENEVSYLLVTGPDGVNQLERRVNNGSPVVIARFVERLCFDDCNTDISIPFGQVRVTLHMRKTASDGRVIRAEYSTLVKMRNYEE